ncbi:MAG: hypothetical protein KatS3mg121_0244 [Gammaproteobacteria bacterium]|nr:MAG: hypothetical protein KatS3mg121_0244 [Gammaproteobacteria bacterium]
MTEAIRPSWRDRLLTLIVALLPQHALSRLVFHLSRRRSRLKNIAIRWFVRRYGVNLAEAACERPEDYPHFNAFFTRALKAGARPIDRDPDALVSPSDGRLSEFGRIETGRLLQAKGHDYRLLDLLGGRRHLAEAFGDGAFTTIYLAPGDYHRVHMPLAGRLQTMLFIPGRLYSVAPFTTRVVRGLFARNQRVVCHFEGEDGPFCVVLVGALNVSAIETVWHGLVRPPRERSGVIEYRYDRSGRCSSTRARSWVASTWARPSSCSPPPSGGTGRNWHRAPACASVSASPNAAAPDRPRPAAGAGRRAPPPRNRRHAWPAASAGAPRTTRLRANGARRAPRSRRWR